MRRLKAHHRLLMKLNQRRRVQLRAYSGVLVAVKADVVVEKNEGASFSGKVKVTITETRSGI
jgi:hypothetical protein